MDKIKTTQNSKPDWEFDGDYDYETGTFAWEREQGINKVDNNVVYKYDCVPSDSQASDNDDSDDEPNETPTDKYGFVVKKIRNPVKPVDEDFEEHFRRKEERDIIDKQLALRKQRQLENMSKSRDMEHNNSKSSSQLYSKDSQWDQKPITSRKMELKQRLPQSKMISSKDLNITKSSVGAKNSKSTSILDDTILRLTKPNTLQKTRIATKKEEARKVQSIKEDKIAKEKGAKIGRKLYPDVDRAGKALKGVDQWTKAYNQATGNVNTSRNPENFYQSKEKGSFKNTMTKSSLLRLQMAEDKKLKK